MHHRNLKTCKYHPDVPLVMDTYGQVCPVCGVVGEIPNLYEGALFNGSDDEDGPAVNAQENKMFSESIAQIGIKNIWHNEKHLNEKGNFKYRAAVQLSKEDKKMMKASDEIHLACNYLNLDNNTFDHSLERFRRYVNSKDKPKVIKRSIYYACIYLACKDLHIARTLGEVIVSSGLTIEESLKALKKILKALSETLQISTVDEYISRFMTHLDLKNSFVHKLANDINKKLIALEIEQTEMPHILAASIILWAAALKKIELKSKDVESNTGVSSVLVKLKLQIFNSNSAKILDGMKI